MNRNLGSMAQSLSKSLVLDGIAASQAIDSSGEILDIRGLDISELEEGRGVLNYEHRSDQSEGASANDVIGHIVFAKKIFGPDDCKNDRELSYWNKVQLPFVYIQAELFNDEGHPGAVAAASLIRYYQRRKLPILMRYSIEGATLEREGNTLKRAIAKRVAATLKPCNRSCVSGVLSDDLDETSTSEKDVLKDLLRSERPFENPQKTKLGGFEAEFLDPVVNDPISMMRDALEDMKEATSFAKAMEAGNFNAAPSTLQGGSALQSESVDRVRFLKYQVMAAVRDWKGRGDLRKFIKHRLPDASDEFIQHFTNLVDDYHMKKSAQLEDNLVKAVSKKPAAPKTAKPVVAAEKPASAQTTRPAKAKAAPVKAEEEAPLTIRGRPVKPNPEITSPKFENGVLHTRRGSFPMYIPKGEEEKSLESILNDPKRTAFHDYATNNWLKVHKLLKEGKLPPEVVMHASLFSMLSPNKAVPMQELMYAHLVDSMKDRGIDARSPKFAEGRQDWLSRDRADNYPRAGNEYFTGPMRSEVTLANPSAPKLYTEKDAAKLGDPSLVGQVRKPGRDAGQLASFMLPDDSYDNMSNYHTLHDSLVEVVNRHRHDARSAIRELMDHKHKAGLWNARRKREVNAGRPDPGAYSAGPDVPGLAPKTGRYMYAMLGGSNVHVPDTHFTRYLFGLEKGHGRVPMDSNTIEYLKEVLWNPNNSHILDAIDHHYVQHHPAVRHMLKHPTFGKHFTDPHDAIFPAFWKNWISVVPHEQSRGMRTGGDNVDTTHAPFWEAVEPYLGKNDEHDHPLPLRTAKLHAKWADQYGEVPAQMMFFAHIVPMLLRNSQKGVISKMERIAQDLRKAAQDMAPEEPQLPPLNRELPHGAMKFHDYHVMPGEVQILSGGFKGSKMHFLGWDDDHVYVKPWGSGDHESPKLLPHDLNGTGFRVNSDPTPVEVPPLVDAHEHGDPVFTKSFDQKSLIHGIDFSQQRDTKNARGVTIDARPEVTGWFTSALGRKGYVKPHVDIDWAHWDPENLHHHNQFETPDREAIYKTMMNDVFGLGQHVPEVGVFRHPQTDEKMSVMERVPNGFHYEYGDPHSADTLHTAYSNGSLDKLGLADMAMGQVDRNDGNYMLTQQAPHVWHIDNAITWDFNAPPQIPHHWDAHDNEHPEVRELNGGKAIVPLGYREVHPEATTWLLGLNHHKYMETALAHNVPLPLAEAGSKRLQAMQLAAMDAKMKGQPLRRWDLIEAARVAGRK
ncbi:putative prohead protease [Myxococcus phage Mx1]|nr:putative prohead protease [Myxococcus phage Mx1]